MNQAKGVFLTLLVGIIVLAGLDIVFNQGQTIAALMPDRTAVVAPYPDSQNLVNSVPIPRPDNNIVIDTSAPPTVIFTQPTFVAPTAVPPTATAIPVATQDDTPEMILIPLPTPELPTNPPGCRGGRSCPRATATPAPGR